MNKSFGQTDTKQPRPSVLCLQYTPVEVPSKPNWYEKGRVTPNPNPTFKSTVSTGNVKQI